MSPTLEKLIHKIERTLRIIWLAMIAAILMYVVVAYVIAGEALPQPDSPEAARSLWLFQVVLMGVALVTIVASFVVPKLMLSDARLRAQMQREPSIEALSSDPVKKTPDPEQRRLVEKLDEKERRLFGLTAIMPMAYIVRWALIEAIAIYGLVLVILTRNPAMILPFAAVAMVLMLVASPNMARVIERAKRLH